MSFSMKNYPTHCRVCEAQLGDPELILPSMPLTDDFVSTAQPDRKEYLADISIYQCGACGLVQNPVDFDHEGYYRDYAYTSGHSPFVKTFMSSYASALLDIYKNIHGKNATSVVEAGSGDGEQLWQFKEQGVSLLCGVEPSVSLTKIANDRGVHTELGFFDVKYAESAAQRYDICLSSYTLDHVRDPRDYLQTAHTLLSTGGLVSFEVHDFDVISSRSEFCLFEHEHTIYMNSAQAAELLRSYGFEVVSVNPVAANKVRGNSLIMVAKRKETVEPKASPAQQGLKLADMRTAQRRVQSLIKRLNEWVDGLPADQALVGFGVGGRGVMTLAALAKPQRFSAMFDSNYVSGQLLTPKTRVPVVGPAEWSLHSQSKCLVFSFGYFQEIRQQLINAGFESSQIISLSDFFEIEPSA
jgi:predicted TPR repeat methyltransferase